MKLPTMGPSHPGDSLCKYLRAKVSNAAHGDRRALWAVKENASTVYWCLLTMGSAGPDDGLVHAERCGSPRECATVDEIGVS